MGRDSRDRFAPRLGLLLAVLCCGGWLLSACEDDHAHEDDGHSHDTCGLEANCMDTVELAQGLTVDGAGGIFSINVLSHSELMPIGNMWMIEVLDASGTKVEDATVTFSTFSVDCMHPGPAEPMAVTANAEGNYHVTPDHIHGGPWNTIFEVEAGGQTDNVAVPLCVPGEGHQSSMQSGSAGMHGGHME